VNRPFADLEAGAERRAGRTADTIPDPSDSPSARWPEAWEAGSAGRDTSDGRDTVARAGRDDAPAGLWDAARDPVVAARSAPDIPQAGDPVDVATGDVLLFQEDVALPGVLPLVIGRAYRSSWRAGRWFGRSWASTFDQRLQVGAEQVTGVFADGRVLTWPSGSGSEESAVRPRLPAAGPSWPLERLDDDAFTVTDPRTGLVWRFEGRPGYPWSAGGTGELPLVSVTDRGGDQVCFSYTPSGEPAWITHSGGYRVQVVMVGGRIAGLALATPDAAAPDLANTDAPLTGYRYDTAGNLARIINSSGKTLRFSYDTLGRLTRWQDRNGIAYRYSYDEQGRCVAGTGPGGVMSGRFAYGDRVTWWTDAAGAVTIYQLDQASRVTAVTDPLGHVTHLWYDDRGRLSARADPLGRLTRFGYDERGNLTCVTQPDGSQVQASYNEACLLVRLDEPGGPSWQREYDSRGRLVRRIAPDQAVTSYRYDSRGHLASVTGPLEAVTEVECDPAGLPVAVTGQGGGSTRYTRDAFGRVTAVTGPGGGVTALTWTPEGQLATRVFADGGAERREYDAEGNLIARVGPSGEEASYEYGPFDLLTGVTGPDGARTELGYDRMLRLTSVTRAGLTWRYEYDVAGRLVAETDYNGAVTRYEYDPAGQLTGQVNAAGQQIGYGYDELGRLTRRVADGVASSFGYDAAGRLVRARNPDAELRFTRDPVGRITAETCNDATVLSTYDLAGRRRRRVTPGGAQQRWDYDDAGHPVRLDASGQVLGFGYDQAGREIRRDLPGGLTLAQDWDTAGQLEQQVLCGAPGSDLARRSYSYRADGFLDGIDDLLAGSRRFTLDAAGRITAVDGSRWAERYRYDQAGNVASARWTAPPPDDASRWLSADVQGPRDRSGTLTTSAGSVRYGHDEQGRVVRRQRRQDSGEPATWSYQWDADDRLTEVTAPDGSIWRYRYDPLGRRIAKQRFGPSGDLAEETAFAWDGAVLAEETTRGPGRRHRMTWDYRPGTFTPLAQCESLSLDDAPQDDTGERFYAIITDQVGMPTELVAADGTVAGYQQHTLWGGTLWHPSGAATPLRFPGQYHDPETGLHYNQQRYYDPVTGSYLTPDPLGLAPAPNPHAYVPNPHLQADPLGLMSCGGKDGRALGVDTSSLTRVGRWMSRVEHVAMLETGMVQEGAGGTTYVADPADPAAYGKQAAMRSRYLEFDVPRDCLIPGGKTGWAQIPGPDSLYGRLAAMRGQPVPQFPPAANIEWLLTK
jgi:RHS repeat-associated protein